MYLACIGFVATVLVMVRQQELLPKEHVVLTIHGSTSLGDDLMPKLAEAFLREEMGAGRTGMRIARRDSKGRPYLHVWGKVPGRPGLQTIEIYAAGSGTAFECLAADQDSQACDIGMSSRPISDQDVLTYPNLVNLKGRDTEHVLALDAIAIIVNPANPVSRLTVGQVRGIYSGEIKNWNEVGGADAPIELFGRDRESGTFEVLNERVMGRDSGGGSVTAVAADHQLADSNLLVRAVAASPNAIGYVSSTMVDPAKALAISDGAGPAIVPTELSVATEDYPICRRLLLYDWDLPGSLTQAFVRYVTYNPGQRIIVPTAFVELTPKVSRIVPSKNAPRAYQRIATDCSRIGLSFHFSDQNAASEPGEYQLDSLARLNVLRLRSFLAEHGGTGADIFLVGYSDRETGKTAKADTARKRVETVASNLRAVGVIVPSDNLISLGPAIPVASNETPDGRHRNRRVEVWVRNGLR